MDTQSAAVTWLIDEDDEATTSKPKSTLIVKVDASDVSITLTDTAVLLAEIQARFQKLEEGVDLILAAIADMRDHVIAHTCEPAMIADVTLLGDDHIHHICTGCGLETDGGPLQASPVVTKFGSISYCAKDCQE